MKSRTTAQRIKAKAVHYCGYMQGHKVYINGTKYPREYGHWYTDLAPEKAIERALRDATNETETGVNSPVWW